MRSCAVVALCALSVAACGGSGAKSTSSGVASSASAAAPASTTTDTVTATVTQPAATTPTGAPTAASGACVAADLALSFLGGQGATGHGELGFALRNVGKRSCRTYGYPGVQFLSRAGQALPTVSTRTTNDFFGSAPLVKLQVAPGATVSFRLGVTHGIASSAGCTTAYGLQAIAPDDTATLHTAIPGGAYECGTATVSPLRPGTSAFH